MIHKLTFKVCVLFIIAVTRFRFPRNESLSSVLRRRYGDGLIKLTRKFERVNKKLRKSELDLSFLHKCDELLLFPNFLNFKVSNSNLKNSPSYDACRRLLLTEEIKYKERKITSLSIELQTIKDDLQINLNFIDYTHVTSCISQITDKYIDEHRTIQDKKLYHLIEKNGSYHNDPSKVIHNFSNYTLTPKEKSLLVKGLNYSINPGKLNYGDYCAEFEQLFVDVRNHAGLSHYNLDIVRSKFKDLALSSFNEHNKNPNKFSNLNKNEFDCLKNLANNNDIIIQKSDKGNAIVILNRSDYVERINEMLSDTSKFEKSNLNNNNILRHLSNVRKSFKFTLDNLLKAKKITQQTYFKLDPIGCKPGILYGLGKVHKSLVNGIPKFRPILSAIGSPFYGLSKFLVPILGPIAYGPYTILNSFSFNKEIQKQDHTFFMGSLDVDALFTSIPLEETINICLDELYKNETLVSNFTKSELKTLLELATKNALFIFDNKYFHQIDGVAMGSPLGPCLANIFMNFYEKIWLDNCPEDIRPIFYRRYVDDIFILCKSEDHLIKFKEYLNSKHPNINFTHEFEEDGKLPFLDMIINRNHGYIQTSVYRKPTFTGVYTHFHSFLPSAYKFGLLSTLLFRYFSLCLSFKLFHLEVLEFKRIFQRNGYPLSIINGAIFKFLNKIFVSKVLIHTVPKREYVITLPYLGP